MTLYFRLLLMFYMYDFYELRTVNRLFDNNKEDPHDGNSYTFNVLCVNLFELELESLKDLALFR